MPAYKCLDCGQYFGRLFFVFRSDREGRCLPCYNIIKEKVDQHDGKLEELEPQVQDTNETVQRHHNDIEVIQRDLPRLQHQLQATNETVQKNHEDIEEIQREIPLLKQQGQATAASMRMQEEKMETIQQQMEMLQQQVQQLQFENLKLQHERLNKSKQVEIETIRLEQEQSKERQKEKDLEQEKEKTKQKSLKERTARLKNETAIKQGENLTKLSQFADRIEGLPEETTIALLNYGKTLVDEDGPLVIGDENLSDSSSHGRSIPDTNYVSMDRVDDYTGSPDTFNSNWTRYHGKPKTAMF